MIDDRANYESLPFASRFAIAPLLPWAIGMIVGIAVESQIPCDPWVCALVIIACGLLACLKPGRPKYLLPLIVLAAAGMGAVRHHIAFRMVPTDDVSRLAIPERQLAKVVGTIASPPSTYRTGYDPFEPWLHTTDRTTFALDIDRVDVGSGLTPTTGQLRVSIAEPTLNVREGDHIEATGWLSSLLPPRNPGQHDWSVHNARRGIRSRLACSRIENISVLQPASNRSRTAAGYFRKLLLGRGSETGDASSSLLDTMVLGHRSAVDDRIERLFLETGCAHYLAVSGIHIAMLASIVWFPARLFGADRRLAAALLIATVIAYVLIADARPSMLRAAVMACTFSFALVLRRRGNTINSLSLAALILLAINPLSLFDIGFQLSFAAVTGIVLLTPIIKTNLMRVFARQSEQHPTDTLPTTPDEIAIVPRPSPSWLTSIRQSILLLIRVSIAAWISTLPIVALHFGRLAPLGWLGSIIAFAFVYVVMVLSFVRLAVGLIIPVADSFVGVPLELSTAFLRHLLGWLRDVLGGPIDVTPPTAIVLCTYYGCLLSIVWAHRQGWTRRRQLYTASLLLFTVVFWNWPTRQSNSLTITQLAVGRGTSTIIELPDGQAWLYDAGSSSTSDPGEHLILPMLRDRQISKLAGIVVSHANLDHYGGVPSIVGRKKCDSVYINTNGAGIADNGPFEVLQQELHQSRQTIAPLHTGDSIDWGDSVHVEVLWPPSGHPAQLSPNDQSIVIRVEYQDRSVLFTGDIGFAAQQSLIATANLTSDVLILPHHGAVEDNTAAFISAVNPTHIIRSSFVKNEESHALSRIVGQTPILNTADHGAIEIRIADGKIKATTFLQPRE